MSNKPDCLCYDCVVQLKKDRKKDPEAHIDCACEGAGDTCRTERCDICDIKEYCDIFLHPENYIYINED